MSKILAVESAPTVANWLPSFENEMSKTSLSCAKILLNKVYLFISNKETEVSNEEHAIKWCYYLFQSKEV